jgi:hypothetical protein
MLFSFHGSPTGELKSQRYSFLTLSFGFNVKKYTMIAA